MNCNVYFNLKIGLYDILKLADGHISIENRVPEVKN